MSVTNLLSWKGEDGIKRSLLIVDKDEMTIEFCEYDSDEQRWETKEVLDSIDDIQSFGIPPGYSV